MALSNWDTLAISFKNGKQESVSGCWKSPLGVGVEIYKNWVHIHDEKAWSENGGFIKPIVMQIQEGIIHYKDIEILVIRGPQNGIYILAWSHVFPKAKKAKIKIEGLIGCGVSGYSGNRYVGVTKKSIKWFIRELKKKEWEEDILYSSTYNSKTKKRKNTKRKLKFYSKIYYFPEEFLNVDLLKGLRFNQGNMFFTQNMGVPLGASKVGKRTGGTTMSKILKEK